MKRYSVNGIPIKVEKIHAGHLVSIKGRAPQVSSKATPLEAAIYVVWDLLGPHLTVETKHWEPWATWHHRTQARTVGDIRMWIRYRRHPFDSYIVKTRTHTIQIPTLSPYRTAQESFEVYDLVAARAARILQRL